MRIAFNAHFLTQPMTGSGQYARNLLAAFAELDADNQYLVVTPEKGSFGPHPLRAMDTKSLADAHQMRYLSLRTPFDSLGPQLAKLWFEQAGVPNLGRREAADVLHYPYFAAPLLADSKVVVTVHDMIPLLLDPYRGSPTVRLYTLLVSVAAKRANAIITDSQSSKADIIRLLRIPAERIAVIYLAVDQCFRVEESRDLLAAVRRKYGLKDDFILYVGGLDYRKNVIALIEAYAEARKSLNSPVQLAIAGQPPRVSSLFPDVKGAVRRLGLDDAVLFLGTIAEEDRPFVYNAARLFVYPSLYEGFGLPPLEAMACGTPVICSSSSSLPEVVGDAALLFSPSDRGELVRALLAVLSDERLRADLRQRGLARARQFSWRKAALETMAVYRAVAASRESSLQSSPSGRGLG